MGHWTGVAYTFKLNKEDSSYEEILVNMQEEIDKKYIEEEKNPGESFGASMSVKKDQLQYGSSGYKSRVSNDLSSALLKKIEKNINTNPDVYYYYRVDNGEGSSIERVYGYAEKVGKYLLDASYANDYGHIGFYSTKGAEKFYECMEDKAALELVIREGEGVRLKRELFGKDHEINEYNFYVKKTPESDYELNEKWLAYWLVYGTETKYNTNFNYYSNPRMNLKEYLFSLDYNSYESIRAINILKDLNRHGVLFKEGLDSIEGNFKLGIRYDNSGREISKEKIEAWYQEHKNPFTKVPTFSKSFANYLKENYPETFLKLKDILIELHNTPKGMRQMSNIQYWSGDTIDKLAENEVFVFGSNPVLSSKKKHP